VYITAGTEVAQTSGVEVVLEIAVSGRTVFEICPFFSRFLFWTCS
jgi:hypothetical protein